MPKAVVNRKTKQEKSFSNEENNLTNSPNLADIFDPEEAQAEYLKRKKSQLALIRKTDRALLREMLYQMVLGRIFEEKCAEVYRLGKIGGFCHLYIGQEAVAVGAIMAVDKERDYIIVAYRDHVQAMVAGISPEAVMAELYGKATGCVKGKGGSMHLFSKEHKFFGGHGIVGGQIGVGTGMAFAQKYRGDGGVTLCFFGEAAVNQGIFHESLNMAQLWKLPIIYICENNQYGMGTSQKRAMSLANIARKADSYGMYGEFVDGMDVMAVRQATLNAIERARRDSLPSLLEVRCYRYMGHSMSDPGKYRTIEEIRKYQQRDPILLFKDSLKEAGVFNEVDFAEIEQQARKKVEEAVEFAERSPFPDESELLTDVLV